MSEYTLPQRGLIAERITKSFATKDGGVNPVLDGVSLKVDPGEIVGLKGPSGAGKSTLGRILSGLEIPDSGQCICDGLSVASIRSRTGQQVRGMIGMVFQSPRRSCDPRMTLGRTIKTAAKVPSPELDEIIHEVGLTTDLLSRFPSQVSDGQLQRAAVARTLGAQPRYLICDEMTAMLDAANSAAIAGVVRRFAQQGGGVLMISHEHRFLDAVSDRVETLGSQ